MQTNLEDPAEMPTAHRAALLSHDDRLFHVILAQQFDRELIEQLCRLSEMIRSIAEARQGAQFLRTLLGHKRAMLYFIQPSTRTFLSFTAACQILGMPYNEVRNPSTSSEVKGETEDDTVRVLSQYFDLIIMRHPEEGFAERMAHMLSEMRRTIPLINGGAGKDQHPTQALLDIYTLYRCLGRPPTERPKPDFSANPFDGKTIAFVGDLQRGRTVRSLAYLLCRYPGVRMLFVSHPDLQIGEDILEYIGRHNVEYALGDDLREVIADCDAVYMTRLQDEWDVEGESRSIDLGSFRLSHDMADRFKPNLVIMHPLPRREEIDTRLDTDPRAKYWDQVRNGMWMRAALIAYVFNQDARIIDHYHSYYAH
ncbi:MAG: aspartate carbamoyltransferase [Planctomycetota bacterium]|jgi:aspartate carbamoyltransferase catalytic subunit